MAHIWKIHVTHICNAGLKMEHYGSALNKSMVHVINIRTCKCDLLYIHIHIDNIVQH